MRVGLANILMKRMGASWDESVDYIVWLARFGDEAGFENIWLTEHHFTDGGATNSPTILLSHLAAVTKKLRLGYSVALLPFHHPIRIAEEMLLLDRLSKGRADLGIGRGHAPLEVAAFCPDPEKSVEQFEDTVQVLKHAFQGEAFKLRGKYWSFPELQLFPPPVQLGGIFYMPITSPRSVEYAAKNDIIPVLGNRSLKEMRETLEAYAQAAKSAGMTDQRLEFMLDHASATRYVAIADSADQAEAQARQDLAYYGTGFQIYRLPVGDPKFTTTMGKLPPLDMPSEELRHASSFMGTPDDIVDQMREMEKAGIHQISISTDAYCTPVEQSQRRIQRFAREVLPHVQRVALAAA